MRESEGGLLNRAFIGRHREREQVKTRLLQDGVLLLYGQPLVGKSSLAIQVAEELREEYEDRQNPTFATFAVDCKDANNWPDVMLEICRSFSLHETAANENRLAATVLQQKSTLGCTKLLLLLLKLHGMRATGNDVTSMARTLRTLASGSVMTVVTSRRQLHLPTCQRLNLSPMTLDEASELLRYQAPDVNAEEFRDLLQRYCYGLPPLVLQVAELVTGDPLLTFTAAELTQELADNPALLMEGLGQEAGQLYTKLSPEVQGHVSCIVTLLDGTFSQEALQAVTGVEDARIKTLMRHLHEESSVIIDNESRRMRIEPLVLHHIRKLGHITADDQARLRVVTLLGRVLTRAEHDLYVTGQDTVYGHLHGDWPQLQHVLRQAIHCTSDTYHAYLQVALKADKLLAKCFPHEALEFYRNMADAAGRYGTSRDLAVMRGLIGMAVTFSTAGTGWEEAVRYFHMALPVLQQERNSVCYLRLLCDIGVANFRINKLHESERYLQEAVSISQGVYVEDERELIFHLLRARSLLALPSIFKGHLVESKALLLETLELCEQFSPFHPDKPIMINSLGLIYERGNEDQDKALHYYKQSLVERRRYQDVAPGDLVVTLNNVGMQYSRRGDHETALTYLAEAEAIRARDTRWHYHTALTQQHTGQVSMTMGDFKKAERHLLEAACVYSRCTPHHDVRGKVALSLAHIYVTRTICDVSQTRRYLQEVCQLAEDKETELSDTGLLVLMSAIQHSVHLEGWKSNKVTSLLTWAQRLLSNFEGDSSSALTTHAALINDLMTINGSHDVIPASQTEALMSRIVDLCPMCEVVRANEDVVSLWQHMDAKRQELRSAVSRLQGSPALQKILSKVPERDDTHGRSGSVGSGLLTGKDSTQHHGVDNNLNITETGHNPIILQRELPQHHQQQQIVHAPQQHLVQQKIDALQRQLLSLQLHQQQEPEGKGDGQLGQFVNIHNREDQNSPLQSDSAGLTAGSSGYIVNDQLKALARESAGPGRWAEGGQAGELSQDLIKGRNAVGGQLQAGSSAEEPIPGLIVLHDQPQALIAQGDALKGLNAIRVEAFQREPGTPECGQLLGASKDSNPPSLNSSDVSMTSVDSDVIGRERSDLITLCQRVVYRDPLQETARDNGDNNGSLQCPAAENALPGVSGILPPYQSEKFIVYYPPVLIEETANVNLQQSASGAGVIFRQPQPATDVIAPQPKHYVSSDDHPNRSLPYNRFPSSSVNVFDIFRDQRNSNEQVFAVPREVEDEGLLLARGPPSVDLIAARQGFVTDHGTRGLSEPSSQLNHSPILSPPFDPSQTSTNQWPPLQYTNHAIQQWQYTNQPFHQSQSTNQPFHQSQPLSHQQPHSPVRPALSSPSLSVSPECSETLIHPVSFNSHPSLSGPPALQMEPTRQSFSSAANSRPPRSQEPSAATASSVASSLRSDVTRLPLTVDQVVTCAQQLQSAIRPEDHVTAAQRLALDQIANSLSAITSTLAGSRSGGVDSQFGMNLVRRDQANKLAFLQEHDQHAPSDQSQSPVRNLHQSQLSKHPAPGQSETARQATQTMWSGLHENTFHAIHQPAKGAQAGNRNSATLAGQKNQSGAAFHSLNTTVRDDQSLALHKLTSAREGTQEEEFAARNVAMSSSGSSSNTEAALLHATELQATELRYTARRREPAEDTEEDTFASSAWTFGISLQLESMSAREEFRSSSFREASENDERLEYPNHVCDNANCSCSLKPR